MRAANIHLPCLDGLLIRESSFLFPFDLLGPILDFLSDRFLSRLFEPFPFDPELLLLPPIEVLGFLVPVLFDRLSRNNNYLVTCNQL